MNNNELKLWYSYKHNYECTPWICTALDVEDLKLRYEKEFNIMMTLEEFEDNYYYNVIDKIDGYKIKIENDNIIFIKEDEMHKYEIMEE